MEGGQPSNRARTLAGGICAGRHSVGPRDVVVLGWKRQAKVPSTHPTKRAGCQGLAVEARGGGGGGGGGGGSLALNSSPWTEL